MDKTEAVQSQLKRMTVFTVGLDISLASGKTPWTVAYRLLRPWDFPGKNTGVGCHFLLQEIFPTLGLNPGLPHCRQTLYRLSHQGNPKEGRSELVMMMGVGVKGVKIY